MFTWIALTMEHSHGMSLVVGWFDCRRLSARAKHESVVKTNRVKQDDTRRANVKEVGYRIKYAHPRAQS